MGFCSGRTGTSASQPQPDDPSAAGCSRFDLLDRLPGDDGRGRELRNFFHRDRRRGRGGVARGLQHVRRLLTVRLPPGALGPSARPPPAHVLLPASALGLQHVRRRLTLRLQYRRRRLAVLRPADALGLELRPHGGDSRVGGGLQRSDLGGDGPRIGSAGRASRHRAAGRA